MSLLGMGIPSFFVDKKRRTKKTYSWNNQWLQG